MLFHFDRRKKSEKEKKPPRFLVLRRKWLTLGAAVLAAAAIFAAVNYPAAVSASAATRQLPIYCVQRDQKVCSISFDAAWGADNTQKILDVLKEYGVTCTFLSWATGRINIRTRPGPSLRAATSLKTTPTRTTTSTRSLPMRSSRT